MPAFARLIRAAYAFGALYQRYAADHREPPLIAIRRHYATRQRRFLLDAATP